MILGKLIVEHRKANKLSLRVMAAQIPVPATTLYRLEQGNSIDAMSFAKILLWLLRRE